MNSLYPLKFKTIFKDKIWGGQKIKSILNKDFSPLPNCGETWELSGVKGNISVVKEGALAGKTLTEVMDTFKGRLLGEKVYQRYGLEFPLLVKFIDANDDLSVQVHPDDQLARERHDSFGKTEMWFVLQADPGATLVSGFNQPMDKQKYLKHFEGGQLMGILNKERVYAEDMFFIPAGRVHTIGKGILLAEIQQTSDVTYRIYDFDRVDDQGNARELHVQEALDAIDYTFHERYKSNYQVKLDEPVELAACPYFKTYRMHCSKSTIRDYADRDSFNILICYEGNFSISYNEISIQMNKGDVVLIPAEVKSVNLETIGGFKALESYVP